MDPRDSRALYGTPLECVAKVVGRTSTCQVSSTDGGRQFIAIIVRLDLVDRTRCDDRRAVAKVRHVALTALLAGLYLGKFEAYILSRPTSLCRNSN